MEGSNHPQNTAARVGPSSDQNRISLVVVLGLIEEDPPPAPSKGGAAMIRRLMKDGGALPVLRPPCSIYGFHEYGRMKVVAFLTEHAADDRMTDKIKQALGLTRSQISSDFDALTVDLTTSSLEAFKLYNEGSRLHLAGEYEKSVRRS